MYEKFNALKWLHDCILSVVEMAHERTCPMIRVYNVKSDLIPNNKPVPLHLCPHNTHAENGMHYGNRDLDEIR